MFFKFDALVRQAGRGLANMRRLLEHWISRANTDLNVLLISGLPFASEITSRGYPDYQMKVGLSYRLLQVGFSDRCH